METVAPVIGLFAFVAFIVGLILFIPVAALKTKRPLAKKLTVGGGFVFIAALALTPTQTPAPSAAPNPTPTARPETTAPPAKTISGNKKSSLDNPDDVLGVIRSTAMQVVFCSGEVDMLQSAIDRANAGSGTVMQAYSAAHIAERDCQKMTREFAESDSRPFRDGRLNEVYAKALTACRSVAEHGIKAASVAKSVLDEDASLKRAQQYLDARNEMVAGVIECRLDLQGLANRAEIPESEVDFLKP